MDISSIENRAVAYLGGSTKFLQLLFNEIEGFKIGDQDCYHFNSPQYLLQWLKTNSPQLLLIDNSDPQEWLYPLLKYLRRSYSSENLVIALLIKEKNHYMKLLARQFEIVELFDVNVTAIQLKRLKFFVEEKRGTPIQQKVLEIYKVPRWKRSFDITCALIALLLLSPLLLLIILLIKLDSKGPVFYISQRVGMNYKLFSFYKFRSMRVNADQELNNLSEFNQYQNEEEELLLECVNCRENCTSLYADDLKVCELQYLRQSQAEVAFTKIKNDPRITALGRFLRRTSLDELPQLFNILKGDMSVVGNRPLPLYEAEQLTEDESSQRFLAPAGLTGLWQVRKRGKQEMSEQERKTLDNEYAEKYSLWYDLRLIYQTLYVFIQKENV